jgi:hypothetical protein
VVAEDVRPIASPAFFMAYLRLGLAVQSPTRLAVPRKVNPDVTNFGGLVWTKRNVRCNLAALDKNLLHAWGAFGFVAVALKHEKSALVWLTVLAALFVIGFGIGAVLGAPTPVTSPPRCL